MKIQNIDLKNDNEKKKSKILNNNKKNQDLFNISNLLCSESSSSLKS